MNALLTKAYLGATNFVSKEITELRKDERGMELLQIILIILIVVVIAAALWAFLGDWVADMLNQITDATPDISAIPGGE